MILFLQQDAYSIYNVQNETESAIYIIVNENTFTTNTVSMFTINCVIFFFAFFNIVKRVVKQLM